MADGCQRPSWGQCSWTRCVLYNFHFIVESNPELYLFCFASLCDWSKKLGPPFQDFSPPTNSKAEKVMTWLRAFSRAWITCLFPFYFLLAPGDISLYLIGCCDYFSFSLSIDTLSESALVSNSWSFCIKLQLVINIVEMLIIIGLFILSFSVSATYNKRVENNQEVVRRVGKDTEDLEEKCDVKKEGERENNTILEKELPSCLHYEGILKKCF